MRIAATLAVLLAVVATALVGVCQRSETRRLEHRVWQLERRRERLERAREQVTTAIERLRTPAVLLQDRSISVHRSAPASSGMREVVPGFRDGENFEQPGAGGAR